MISRRAFIQRSSFAVAGMACINSYLAHAAAATGPLGKPIGLQLYTLRNETKKDLLGTLKAVADVGYREVELAGYYDKTPQEFRKILDNVGLTATSSHRGLDILLKDAQREIDATATLGAKNLVVPFPAVPDNRFANQAPGATQTIANSMTSADWKWIAEQLNKLGEQAKKSGIRVGYHNHNMEFRRIDGAVALDQLIAWTDPSLVTFELDLAWVVTAGFDPVAYLKKYPERISLLHVKDVKKGVPTVVDKVETVTTEVGNGQIDWKKVFAACDPKQIKHYYVEQEHYERPGVDAVRISYDYLSKLKV